MRIEKWNIKWTELTCEVVSFTEENREIELLQVGDLPPEASVTGIGDFLAEVVPAASFIEGCRQLSRAGAGVFKAPLIGWDGKPAILRPRDRSTYQ